MKSVVSYLHLRDVGAMELLFAMTPILSRYGFSFLPFSFLLPTLLITMSIIKRGQVRICNYKPIKHFLFFFVAHQLVWLFVMPSIPPSYFNSILNYIISILAILFVAQTMDYKKMIGSINWVALLGIAGMLYHFSIALRGGTFTPLNLPFMSGLDTTDWAHKDAATRPMSFFSEPAIYAAFMLIPLFIALFEKKYIWAGIIVVSIFMSSSSTGLVSSFILVSFILFTQKMRFGMRLLVTMLMGLMFVVLTQTDLFTQGTEKIENLNVETNIRMSQGPIVVSSMKLSDYFLGVKYASAYHYCRNNPIGAEVVYYGETVYMSSFWAILLLFGVVGLMFYLNIYWRFVKENRYLIPFVVCLIATLFSASYFLGTLFFFQCCFMLSFHKYCISRGLIEKNRKWK